MKNTTSLFSKICILSLSICFSSVALSKTDSLPSWNDGKTKSSIINFVEKTTTEGSPNFVEAKDRIATFDQDGTLWVEHPMYTQFLYVFDRIEQLAKEQPKMKEAEPFKTVLSKDPKKISKLTPEQLNIIAVTALTGMDLEAYNKEVSEWLKKAKDPRWDKHYTELTYQPMVELLNYLRDNGYKTFIVTGGGQNFVRVYSNDVYGIPPEQVMGSSFMTKYSYTKAGKPILLIEPSLLINDDFGGKVRGIELLIGKKPIISVGNSTGDREMLEYTTSGNGLRLGMLVFHDDEVREYAYGPAQGLPDTEVGTFTQSLYDEAMAKNWIVISMKNDWKKIFSFEAQ
ncbi:HAD family hydrolase [Providencia sneebia]|uniref:NapD-like protein n=1 Tax=Providencia sneebia DSM 19967 TaxID=1141660 RepID=K8WXG3_9GAMM|nr:HAD family hydrolase [Providencia sneebia]EKT60870.1 NapD-like protein [Providencia sneebia DSM 19967]